jgi:hypothetical protein|tara:strand:- start:2438 stop:2668 length:231 start_codon:yes stop_codon:yes gene_type:complete
MNNVRAFAISYLFHKAVSDQEKAQLSLELLMNNAAGIGDHSTGDFHQNLDEALDLLVDARDRLELLRSNYPDFLED